MKIIIVLVLCLFQNVLCSSIYDFKAVDIHGLEVDFDRFRGKVLLIVNVASECGFTDSHYRELQRIQDVLGFDDHFHVLGFPCNQFGGQEPGDEAIIDHSNEGFLEEQGCPALNGQVFEWITNIGNIFIVLGFLFMSVCGILPKLFQLCQLRDEAICCGTLFMGYFGKFLVFVATIIVILYNIYGTFILREANRQDIQWEIRVPKDKAKSYCDKTVVTLFKTMIYGIYAAIGMIFCISIFFCCKKMCGWGPKLSQTEKDDKMKIDFDAEEKEFLKVCGYDIDMQEKKNPKKKRKTVSTKLKKNIKK